MAELSALERLKAKAAEAKAKREGTVVETVQVAVTPSGKPAQPATSEPEFVPAYYLHDGTGEYVWMESLADLEAACRNEIFDHIGTAEEVAVHKARLALESAVKVTAPATAKPSLQSALADLSSELAAPESASANATVVALGFELAEKLESLQAALLADHPRLPLLLRDIHSRLRDDPDTVTMLRPEDRGVIVAALRKHHRVEIMTKPAKSTAAKASLKNITADDL